MYSADCGIVDSRTCGLTDLRTFTDSWNALFFADTLQRVSPRILEFTECRFGGLFSILSYIMSLYPSHLLIYVRFASGAVKTVREHSMAPAGRFEGAYAPLRPPPHPHRGTATGQCSHTNFTSSLEWLNDRGSDL